MVEEVLEFSRTTEACWLDAELHRKKGELLLVGTDAEAAQAEKEFCQAIDIARDQSAKLFELRAATSLARLWSAAAEAPRHRSCWADACAVRRGGGYSRCAGSSRVACGIGRDVVAGLMSPPVAV